MDGTGKICEKYFKIAKKGVNKLIIEPKTHTKKKKSEQFAKKKAKSALG